MIRFIIALNLVSLLFLNALTAQNFNTHKVKKGETIEDIAKQYHLNPADIYKLNPDIKKDLKSDMILILPASKVNEPKAVAKDVEVFKTHKVKSKETLYSISKEYGVSEEDLKKYNTTLYANPVKKGDDLQIPVFKTKGSVAEKKSTKSYTVLPKEGKWRIAHKFGITVEELDRLNPNLGDVVQEGQEINVPNVNASEEKEIDDSGYYTVLPQEGFYSLKAKLGLEQEELERLNPGLKETGLKSGMVLKLPSTSKTIKVEDKLNKNLSSTNLVSKISNGSTKRIAIMLPFSLNRIDIDSVANTKASIKKDPYLNASLDFYSGVTMAIDSLNTLGVKLEVNVYDTKRDIAEVTKILNENNLKEMDAVIGPITANIFEKVALELKPYKVPVVSPIGVNLNLHENVFQSKPSSDLLKGKIISFIKRNHLPSNIVVVSDSKSNEIANSIKREFSNAKSVFSRKNKDGKDANYILVDDIKTKLVAGKNIVFLETQNAGFASNVTSILASLIKLDINIILVTTNFNSAFESDEISNDQLSKLHLHFAATSKTSNENDPFVKKYKSIYHITPETSAIKGFDLTMDVVKRLISSGDLYTSVTKVPVTEYVENKFSYKKKPAGGYYNDAVYVVKYEDLAIVEVE